jgi:hypothetical protein
MYRNAYTLSGLKRQYGVYLGLAKAGEDRSEDLAHLVAVIRMFDPDFDPASVRPIRPHKGTYRNWLRPALDVMRKAARPMAAPEIAALVLAQEGGEPSELTSIICTLHAVLGRLEGNGVVRVAGRPKRWIVGG